MPLITWAVLTYALALIAALSVGSAERAGLAGVALVAALLFLWRGRQAIAFIFAIMAAACLIAIATVAHDDACGVQLARRNEWAITFEQDAAEGGVAHGVADDGGCRGSVALIVRRGRVQGGDAASVSGTGSSGPRGLFIQNASIGAGHRASALVAMRAATGRRIDRIFATDAPMVRALVIGDMSGIPVEVRDRYARAGLVHMLSVSGLHVGIIALALELLASVLRAPQRPARIATLVILAAYVVAIGAPPPAVRAAVMLAALLLTRLIQRPTSKWAILALGAGLPLVDPHIALDLGWQLSVAGTAALIAGGALSRRVIPKKWRPGARSLASAAIISMVATASTAPLVAWTFGRVALLGPATNLLADPVMGLLQPLLFLGVAIPVHGVEVWTADASHALLATFDAIARGAVRVPFAAPVVMPTVFAAVAAAVASMALLVACSARHAAPAALVSLGCCAVLVLEPLLPGRTGVPELHMLDVGQGDAFAIRTSRGRWIVVDAGRTWQGGDAGRAVVAPYIAQRGGDVALFVLSHPHADHVGGASSLFALRRPQQFLDPGYVGTTPTYRAALAEAERDRIRWHRAHPGETMHIDDVAITTLAPDSSWAASLDDANLASTVLLVHIGGRRVLFTGDAEGPEEDWLLEHYADSLRADVLKVGHHGSRTSTTPAFLDAVHPRIALISVGAHNAYGHPDAEVIEELNASRIAVARTDRLGTVVLRFTRSGIELHARALDWRATSGDTP